MNQVLTVNPSLNKYPVGSGSLETLTDNRQALDVWTILGVWFDEAVKMLNIGISPPGGEVCPCILSPFLLHTSFRLCLLHLVKGNMLYVDATESEINSLVMGQRALFLNPGLFEVLRRLE